MFDELTGLKNIHTALVEADRMVKAYVSAMDDIDQKKAAGVAVDALRYPLNGFLGMIEMRIFDIDPDALDQEDEEDA